jgi:hypothetical protein
MLHLADWCSGHLNSKEVIDLPYLHNSHDDLAHGQMFNKSNREATLIAVSIAGVRITSSEIVRGPRNLIKGKDLIRITRIRARGRWCKSGKGELTSPPLQNFQMEPPSCRVHFLFITTLLLHYLIQEQLIVSLVTTVVPE